MHKKIIVTGALISMLSLGTLVTTAESRPEVVPETNGAKTVNNTAKIGCVGTAVNTREQSLGTAIGAFTSATNSSYSARAAALKQAYTLTSTTEVKTAVKKAWSDFNTAQKNARQSWRKSRDEAWSKFKKEARVCKAPGSISDSVNSSSETTGN